MIGIGVCVGRTGAGVGGTRVGFLGTRVRVGNGTMPTVGAEPIRIKVGGGGVEVSVGAAELLDASSAGDDYTDEGLRNDVNVGIQYISSWLRGNGAAAIYNLMEDAATAEIARSQVWQWLHHGKVSRDQVERVTEEEVAKLGDGYDEARELFEQVATRDEFVEFLTLPAYERLA